MKVTLRYAVLRFHPDLTDPLAEPIPVGVIAVGELTPTQGFCFVATVNRSSVPVSSDSFGLLADLGELVGKLTREGLKQAGQGGLFRWLQACLGHTLALGQSIEHSVSVAASPPTVDQLLPALSALYREHVSVPGSSAASLPAVRFDVTETSAQG